VSVASHDFSQPLIYLHPSSSCRAPLSPFDVTKSAVAELLDAHFLRPSVTPYLSFATEQSTCLCRALFFNDSLFSLYFTGGHGWRLSSLQKLLVFQ
jgi:hypothetical protein